MRPKKAILYVCADEAVRSRRLFVLTTKGYRVLPTGSAAEALAKLAGIATDSAHLLLAELPLEDVEGLLLAGKGMHPQLRTLVLVKDRSDGSAGSADCCVPLTAGTNELLYRIALLTMRKRGPKKAEAAYLAVEAVAS